MYDQWEAQLLALIRLKARVGLFSELPADACGAPTSSRSPTSRPRWPRSSARRRDAPVAVLPEGPMTIPYLAPRRLRPRGGPETRSALLDADRDLFVRLHDHEPVTLEPHLERLASAAPDQAAEGDVGLDLRREVARPRHRRVGSVTMGSPGVHRSVSGAPWDMMAIIPGPVSFSENSPPASMPATRRCIVIVVAGRCPRRPGGRCR